MYKLIPSVCEFLANEESIHSVRLLQYMELMESGRFPTTNICYRVFLDIVKWYSISKPSDMRYSPDVKQFWHLGKVLFHSKFDLYASFWLWKCTRYHHFTSRVRNFDTKIFALLYFTPSLVKMDWELLEETLLIDVQTDICYFAAALGLIPVVAVVVDIYKMFH